MSDPAVSHSDADHGHEDPMSHVPPGSIWPLILSIGLILMPFSTLAILGTLKFDVSHWNAAWTGTFQVSPALGEVTLLLGGLILLFGLMGWAHQIIKEKAISHDLIQQEKDLKLFTLLFLGGELAAFGAIFAYFYHRKIWGDEHFAPLHVPGFHFGGPTAAFATFILIFSSVTCEIAHRCVEHGKRGLGKFMLLFTIVLGVIFLGFQGYEYGELVQRGFTPVSLGDHGSAAFASLFFAGTGFHGLHVAIGLIMLFMVLMRLELGHFRGKRQYSMIAASWYWHFVDIVWVALFITVYVVA